MISNCTNNINNINNTGNLFVGMDNNNNINTIGNLLQLNNNKCNFGLFPFGNININDTNADQLQFLNYNNNNNPSQTSTIMNISYNQLFQEADAAIAAIDDIGTIIDSNIIENENIVDPCIKMPKNYWK